MHKFSFIFACFFIAAVLFCATPAYSVAPYADITWDYFQNIEGDSDVSTNGSLIYAYRFGFTGVSSQTINGVTFAGFAATPTVEQTIGNVTLKCDGVYLNMTSVNAPFSSLSNEYQALLSSVIAGATTMKIQFAGLTEGHTYQFQMWLCSTNNVIWGPSYVQDETNSLFLSPNVTFSDGGLGQYAIGSFTPGSTGSVAIDFVPGMAYAAINAFQIRDITSVPEPATYLLLIIEGMVLGGIRSCRR